MTRMPANPKSELGLRSFMRLFHVLGLLMGTVGVAMLRGAGDTIPPLAQPDAVFGVSTRAFLAAAGLIHIAGAACLIFLRDPIKLGVVACWVGFNHLVYAAGAAWLKPPAGIPAMVVLAWEAGLTVPMVAILWKLLVSCLILGGSILVLMERQRLQSLEVTAFLNRWRTLRQNQPNPPQPPAASQPP